MKAIIFLLFLTFSTPISSQDDYQLPDYVLKDLNKISFTYDLLERIADSIFTGWNDYRNIPVRITYENGLQVYLNFPELHDNLFRCENEKFKDLQIFIDTSNAEDFSLDPPLHMGGGANTIGKVGGKYIWGLNLRSYRIPENFEGNKIIFTTESDISTIIHELTHAEQNKFGLQYKSMNFYYDPNINYSVYSTMEGLALRNGFFAKNFQERDKLLEEFLYLRNIKRSYMDSTNIKRESDEEFNEGLAVYAEYKMFQAVENNEYLFEDLISKYNLKPDLYNNIEEHNNYLLSIFEKHLYESLYPHDKVYGYGLLQALLNDDIAGATKRWLINKDYRYFDEIMAAEISISEEINLDSLKEKYGYKKIVNFHSPVINTRDSLVQLINNREGKFYTINLKNVRQTVFPLVDRKKPNYRYDGDYYFGEGTGDLAFDSVSIKIKSNLAKIHNLYNLEFYDDTLTPIDLKYSMIKDGNVYKDVKIITPIFELKAPTVRITEEENAMTIEILSRI